MNEASHCYVVVVLFRLGRVFVADFLFKVRSKIDSNIKDYKLTWKLEVLIFNSLQFFNRKFMIEVLV